jgi:hypothetical protein
MTAQHSTFERMGMARLVAASVQREEHDEQQAVKADEAARILVERLVDLEIERRMVLMHERPGWHPSSPGFGDGTGKSSVPTDSMYLAYVKGIRLGEWHDVARRALGKIPERQRLAVLIRGVKRDGRLQGAWAATYDDIARHLGGYAQQLGWPPGVAALRWYAAGQAIKRAAHVGRTELLLMCKAGVV